MIDFIKDLWGFMKERKKFWLAPIILVMLLLGVLIVVAQGSAVVLNTRAASGASWTGSTVSSLSASPTTATPRSLGEGK